MVDLNTLQQQFKNGILHAEPDVLSHIEEFSGISPTGRLNVYKNNTLVSLKECLLSTFEHTADVISVEFFRYLSDEFIRSCPPDSGCLLHFGEKFSRFIRTFGPLKDHTYLSDFAEMEWLMQECLNAEKNEHLTAKDLTDLSEQELINHAFKLQPHIRLISSPYSIFSLYQFIKTAQESGHPPALPHDFDLYQDEIVMIIQNDDGGCDLLSISSAFYAFLTAFQQGQTFAEAVEQMNPHLKEDETFEGILTNCLDNKIFIQTVK